VTASGGLPGTVPSPAGPIGLNTPLRHLSLRPPLTVPPSATVAEALQALDRGNSESLVVIDPLTRVPLGLLTLRDVLRRVAIAGLAGDDLQQPVAALMTSGLVTLPAEASVHQATVLMVRRRLHRVVLTDSAGQLFNVVSQGELHGLQGAGSDALLQAIIDARDIPTLARLAQEVRAFAVRRLNEGVGAEALCQWNSALNDMIALQVLDVVEAQHDLPYVPWCWLVFGSEGRLEQTLVTDQDNGIIFAAENAAETDTLRQQFLPFAQAVNTALDACGYPLCKGNIMAGNPQWCLSLDEWKSVFAGWVMEARPDALLNSTIFFDFRPLYGAEELATRLRDTLFSWTTANPAFLRSMAAIAVDIEPPLGWLRDFRFDDKAHPRTIDIKLRGSRFFVDIARIRALADGIAPTNTAERLREVGARKGRPVEESAAAIEAFYHILRLRLRQEAAIGAADGSHRVAPEALHALDRHILKEAFRQAKMLQDVIRIEYQL
jgi:CBS domain-containing protein